jgi:hypothetical protein
MISTRTARACACALVSVLALASCKKSSTGSSGTSGDSFSSNTLSSYSSHTDGGANWAIAGGQLIGTGPAIQSVLVRNGVSFTDGWVEAVSPGADDGGLVLRYVSGTNYYLLAFRDDGAPSPRGSMNLAVYHHINDEYDQMWVHDVSWPVGTTHTIRFEAAGGTLKVYFDGAQQVILSPSPMINDPAPYFGAGGIGIRHYGAEPTWVTTFDEFRWHSNDD